MEHTNKYSHFSPHHKGSLTSSSNSNDNPIQNKERLEEKLLLASVSNAVIAKSDSQSDNNFDTNERLNGRILNDADDELNEPLLLDKSQFRGYPRTLGAPKNDLLSFSGSDCELNWIFLLVAILAFCVIFPLIIFYFVYEHPEKFHSEHSKYDDPDLHYLHHLNLTLIKQH
jgi:hypothetical protein